MDEEAGAVIGIVTGAGMVNRVEGRRGFGTPAEALFEVCIECCPVLCAQKRSRWPSSADTDFVRCLRFLGFYATRLDYVRDE